MSFEQNSDWLVDAPTQTIEDIGRYLLNELQAKRSPHLPIIFIGHSLGGIIIKQALCFQNSKEIMDTTSGIIFLGAPHLGSSVSTAAAILASVTAFLGSDSTLLLSLRSDEAQLSILANTFKSCISAMESRGKKLRIAAFYETKRTYLLRWSLGTIVSRNSATLHAHDEHGIHTDHSGLNKCAGLNDELYKRLNETIDSMIAPSLIEQADKLIQDGYGERLTIQRLCGEPLPMQQCYINLAIVELAKLQADGTEAEEANASPFSLLSRQKIELPINTVQVDLKAVFNERKCQDGVVKQPRRILIRGRAGVGKTTLCKKIVAEFYQHTWTEWSQIFDRVLWVPLRNLKLLERQQSTYNLQDLFIDEYTSQGKNRSELATALFDEVGRKPSKTLFLLDGLDEVSQDLNGDSAMSRFLKHLLNKPNIIITSRPSGTLPGHVNAPDLELETTGFHPEQVQPYIERIFTDRDKNEVDVKRVNNVRSFLDSRPLIRGLVRIPIQLDALCYTWDTLDEGSVLSTMTGIYRSIVDNLWKKDAIKLQKKQNGETLKMDQIGISSVEACVKDEIYFLEGLAFTGMYNNVIEFTPKHRKDVLRQLELTEMFLEGKLPLLSFIRTSDLPGRKNQSYHFIHLTYQEYFAAKYFVRGWKTKNKLLCRDFTSARMEEVDVQRFLQEHKYSGQYDMMWRFVTGFLADKEEQLVDFFNAIEDQPRDLLGPTHQRLIMHCLSELDSSIHLAIRSKLKHQLLKWLIFECHLTGRSTLAAEMECPEDVVIAALEKSSARVRKAILKAISLQRVQFQEKTILAITELYNDEDPYVQIAAVGALNNQWDVPEATTATLLKLLDHKNETVRRGASVALSKLRNLSEATVFALLELLKDKDGHIWEIATEALRRHLNLSEPIITALLNFLLHEKQGLRSAAAITLSNQRNLSEATITVLLEMLQNEDSATRSAATNAFKYQSDLSKAVTAALLSLLKDKDEGVRDAASYALSRQSNLSEAAVVALAELLKDKDPKASSAATFALGTQLNPSEAAVTALIELLKDKNPNARSNAAFALGRQLNPSEAAVIALTELLKDKDPNARSDAAFALGRQSNLSEAVITALTELLTYKDDSIRESSAQLLGHSKLLEKALHVMEFMSQTKRTSKKVSHTVRQSQFVESLYATMVRQSFREQLSLYVFDDSTSCYCIINSSTWRRTISFERNTLGDFRAAILSGRQRLNAGEYAPWNNGEGDELQ
ncbi:hypothetical protein QQS21_012597 [Conoideocrella luteorostrata]|uniref:NACHT domain-containing protein n=1 Tax=Conoideocrella luteorostrata TaxID=1105319 RepID=A0AAJ0FSB5_9HYPO|nr:hypothetical protein QQS21_012597 [Conoideocrella luteorostrata]